MTLSWEGAAGLPQLPFRRLFRRLERPVPPDAGVVTAYTDGQVTLRSNRDKERYHEAADLSTYQGVEPGDFVVHGLDILRGSVGVADSHGAMSPVCTVAAPTQRVDPRYVAYAMRLMSLSGYPKALARGVRDGGADFRRWDTLGALPIPVPPKERQRAIADFLDRETAKIDALIDKQGQLVASLFLRRANLIEAAVGAVAGRTTTQLKHALKRIDQGISPDTSSADDSADWAVLKAGCSNHGVFREDESKPLPTAVAIPPGISVRPGDLITSRANGSPRLVGSTALVGNLTKKLILSDKTFRLVPRRGVSAQYLFWVMNSDGYRAQVIAGISGAEGLANNLPLSTLRRIRIWLPDLSAQNVIASGLERKTARIDALTDRAERMITLARERRAALITAAVTGELDVSTGEVD